jgi:hypothetical protein
MISQAYFENIQQVIIDKISNAKHSIYVAVAWLTDHEIFNKLCEKAQNGVQIELMLMSDRINNDMTSIEHDKLKEFGGRVYFIPEDQNGSIMHHKFCIIDGATVITGSYNWSKKAQLNDENIIVSEDASGLAQQFLQEFKSIIQRTTGNENHTITYDYAKIMKRLEVIKLFVALEENENVREQLNILKIISLPNNVVEIVQKLEQKQFGDALRLIEVFIKDNNQMVVFEDGEAFGLQLEIKTLEVQLNAIENELIEAEKLVNEFMVRHTKELGLLLLELLDLKKQMAQDEEELKEAEEDEKAYREGYDAKKDIVIPVITEEEKKDLSKMYREASFMCHPDKFSNESPEKQKMAEELFKDLANAYSNNDINRVNTILNNLKNGILEIDPKNSIQKKEQLKIRVEELKLKIKEAMDRLNEVKQSEVYETATVNDDWDGYFNEARTNLEKQINELKDSLKDE